MYPSTLFSLKKFTYEIYNSSSLPGQNGPQFAEDILKCIFMNEKPYISTKISLEFVPKGPNDKKSTLVQVMTCHRTGDKPLPEPTLTHFNDEYVRH